MEDRIFVRIFAGLGNQLFQYAMGRAMAARSNSELVLDLRSFRNGASPQFGLSHFNVRYATDDAALPPIRREHRVRYFLWRKLNLPPERVFRSSAAFDPTIAPRSGIYLEGYWQSERYFREFETTIREELRFSSAPDPENAAWLDAIGASPAVSLHVRRGDYLLPKHRLMFGSCSLEYYREAVDFIAARMMTEPVIYLFSDDPEWARENLRLPLETRLVTHNGPDRPHEDLRLMSACRHHVIANSTFSWWGAWLNPSRDKIVVAPKTWTLDPAIYNPDILPEGWHTIENAEGQGEFKPAS